MYLFRNINIYLWQILTKFFVDQIFGFGASENFVAYFYVKGKGSKHQTGIEEKERDESNTRISHGLSHETPTLVGYLIERITNEEKEL